MIETETIGQAQDRSSPGVQDDFSALDFLVLLVHHKRFIVRLTLAAAVLASIVTLLIPNSFTATTTLLPPQQSSMSSALLNQLGGAGSLVSLAAGNLGVKNSGEMYVSFLRGRTVEDSVVQRFGLMGRYHAKGMTEARKALEAHSTVSLGLKDGLLRITMTDRDPKLAAEMTNGYVDEFKKLSANLAVTEASQRRLFFQQQLLEARGNLTAAEEAMKNTELSTGVLQLDSQAKALIESAASLRAQAVAKEVQIESMRAYATEDNPDLIMAKRQLAELHAQLDKLAGHGSDQFLVPKGKAPEAGMEYIRKLRDVKYNETVYELIAKQFELAKLDEAREGAIIQVVDVAVPPDRKSGPMRTLIVLLTTLLVFFIACGWCAFAEHIQRMRKNPADRQRLDALRAIFR